MPSAPLAPTSQSRERVKTYPTAEKRIELEADKENEVHHSMPERRDAPRYQSQQSLSQKLGSQQRTTCPKTPVPKISLTDLIGNTEDNFNAAAFEGTPQDHVFWQNGPRSTNTTSSSQRGQKRARSSSPPSSSQLEKSNHFPAEKDTLGLQNLQRSLNTPHNDPATDLWARYATGSLAKTTADGAPLPPFAHLMTSSPQTPSTTNSKDSALRRSISCGIEWPTSKAKRRKIETEEPYARVRDLFATSKQDILAQNKPRASRVGLLVEKIQESLSRKPAAEVAEPSSSSPLPERTGIPEGPELSPVPKKDVRKANDQALTERPPSEQPPAASRASRPDHKGLSNDGDSSDFGDADLDLTFLEEVELSRTQDAPQTEQAQDIVNAPNVPQLPNAGTQPALSRAEYGRFQEMVHTQQHKMPGKSVNVVGQDSDYEFGMSSDDAIATEMQDLVHQAETQESTLSGVAPVQRNPRLGHLDSGLDSHMQNEVEDDSFGNVFDDDEHLWEELGNAISPRRLAAVGSTSQKLTNNRAIKRYLILDVVESDQENAQGRKRPEKILSVKDEKTHMLKLISLRQSWYDSRCTKGSYIHLIGEFDRTGQCVVDDADNMIILHPDHLISATVVADSFTCTRRAVLQDRVKATGSAEKQQVYGSILHEVFGEALKANNWRLEQLQSIIERIVTNYVESLYEINVSVEQAIDHLMSKTPYLLAWASIFVTATPGTQAVVHDRNGALTSMSINKLLELEEHVWSPMYGLKGNVDATVQVAMQLPGESSSRTLTVPLELKTGKKDNNEAHRAQTQLYTLLMTDRYDVEVTTGVLYYLETAKMFRVEGLRNEIRHMLIQRNELACYVRNKLELPPMVKKPHMCKNCYAQTSCYVYHKLVEDGDGETSGLKELFTDAMSHLRPNHQTFFQKWDGLLTKEEKDAMKLRRELWTMLSTEREALGRCFGNVVIEPGSAYEDLVAPKINRYQYTFIKEKSSPSFSFTESQLTIGEPIVVSDEKGHFALANGYVTNVRPSRLTVAVDRRLHNARKKIRGFSATDNQTFQGIMDVNKNTSVQFASLASQQEDAVLYRVDKDEFSNGMATARNNLIRIMEKDLFRARELRQLIIECSAPSFKPASSAYALSSPASQQNVNVDQRRAIEKVMTARDYALVLGMPGTGKTTTIAHIIRALVSQNKSVLLTSYTHTAVDNILLKIKDDDIPVLRLGAIGKVHPEVQTFADLGGIPKKTIAELENSYANSKVVATTCLGINQPIFHSRIFDYCIVDEASQITLPVCLGPIRMARTFILVGDHYQLPPLVQNKEAQEGGLDVSLFKLLSDAQPNSVVNLEHQYRMAEDIMLLSNMLIYNGRLKCGTRAVADRLLQIPNLEGGLEAHHYSARSLSVSATPSSICASQSSCWLHRALSPQSRCLFLNTDTLSSRGLEKLSGPRITNPAEAILTTQLVTTLLRSGISPKSIGVITFYRSQLALLRQEVKAVAGTAAASDLEMHTADKFQGRDKEVVILSCVRSNEARSIGELLKDWRRVNVAVTRARSKLLILGSKSTLGGSGNEVLENLVKLMDSKGWMHDVPGNALTQHMFEGGSQSTGMVAASAKSPQRSQRHSPSPTPSKGGVFRKPKKIVKGGLDVEKMLDKRPVMRDIINGM